MRKTAAMFMLTLRFSVVCLAAGLLPLGATRAQPASAAAASSAPMADTPLSPGWQFNQRQGDNLYRAACQACHMPDGQGATGAGSYPALRDNPRLLPAEYVIHNVLHGRKAMPPVGEMLSDEQVATVINHVRSRFAPKSADGSPLAPVTAADVKRQR